ncbi:MAG: hypothetical protein QM770_00295 [Tepidisphaeraceae bacterium]
MILYVWRAFTTTLTNKRRVNVTCDKCHTAYCYELVRTATGVGRAPYLVGQTEAQARSTHLAARSLRKRLATEADPVPCPTCHWINESLVRGCRLSRYRWVLPFAGVMALMAFVASVFAIVAMEGPKRHSITSSPLQLLAITLGSAAAVFGIGWSVQWLLRRTIRPNRRYPQPPVIPAGTPAPIVDATVSTSPAPLGNVTAMSGATPPMTLPPRPKR